MRPGETLSPRNLYVGPGGGSGVGVDHEFEGAPLPVLYSAHCRALKIPGAPRGHSPGERNPDAEAACVLRLPKDSLGTQRFEFSA